MGGALFSLCYLTWGQTMVDIIGPFEGDGSFKMSHACTAICSTPKPAAGHCQPMPLLRLLDTHGQVWVNLFWGHCSFLLGPGAYKGFVHPPRVCFPVLGKFWQFYGGVNDDLLQEGLYHTQVYCTQSPCPCSSPLLTHTSTGNTQTQFCLSLRGSLGPGAHEVCLSPLRVSGGYGFILNMISPLLPSCRGFSFAVGCEVSRQSHSRAIQRRKGKIYSFECRVQKTSKDR